MSSSFFSEANVDNDDARRRRPAAQLLHFDVTTSRVFWLKRLHRESGKGAEELYLLTFLLHKRAFFRRQRSCSFHFLYTQAMQDDAREGSRRLLLWVWLVLLRGALSFCPVAFKDRVGIQVTAGHLSMRDDLEGTKILEHRKCVEKLCLAVLE